MTLVEVTVTLVIMGIASVTMSMSVASIVMHSSANRDASILDAELRRVSEILRATPYQGCAEPVQYQQAMPEKEDLADGITAATVTEVAVWQRGSDPPRWDDTTGQTCVADPGLQLVTFEITSEYRSESRTVVKRMFG